MSFGYDDIPHHEQLVDGDGRPTLWFQALWQRMINARPVQGSGSFDAVSGVVTIPHRLGVAPAIGGCSVSPITSATAIVATLVGVDEEKIRAKLWVSGTGAAVADGPFVVAWRAARS